jgi:transposase-like protein
VRRRRSEGAKFWPSVLTEINNRGVEDMCIAVCDRLNGLPESITTTWQYAQVQACIMHYADLPIMPMWSRIPCSKRFRAGEVGIIQPVSEWQCRGVSHGRDPLASGDSERAWQ